MVGTIAPLVQEVAERGQRIRAQRILAAHVLSTAAGALTVGIAVWALRLALQAVVPQLARQLVALGPVLLALAALYLLAAVLTGSLRLPMLDRQVPQEWRVRIGPERASLAYGFVLGTGVLTRINSPAFYLLPLALLVTPSPALGLVLAALFGLARGRPAQRPRAGRHPGSPAASQPGHAATDPPYCRDGRRRQHRRLAAKPPVKGVVTWSRTASNCSTGAPRGEGSWYGPARCSRLPGWLSGRRHWARSGQRPAPAEPAAAPGAGAAPKPWGGAVRGIPTRATPGCAATRGPRRCSAGTAAKATSARATARNRAASPATEARISARDRHGGVDLVIGPLHAQPDWPDLRLPGRLHSCAHHMPGPVAASSGEPPHHRRAGLASDRDQAGSTGSS
jgi:hypothetical protein